MMVLANDDAAMRSNVSATLAELWPLLLKASTAADGPDPASAELHLRAGADLLRRAADRPLVALAADYKRRVEDLADRLRPRIESGELAPWHPSDDRWEDVQSGAKTPGDVLEELCRGALAPTREAAHLVLAVSTHGPKVDAEQRGATVDPRYIAGAAITADVLEYGRASGWYTPPRLTRLPRALRRRSRGARGRSGPHEAARG